MNYEMTIPNQMLSWYVRGFIGRFSSGQVNKLIVNFENQMNKTQLKMKEQIIWKRKRTENYVLTPQTYAPTNNST